MPESRDRNRRYRMLSFWLGLAGILAGPGFAAPQEQHGSRASIDRMRDQALPPDRIMDAIGLRPGLAAGEAGASYGYFTFKMSRRIGDLGKVYANDIAPEALRAIEDRCQAENIRNIVTVLGAEDDPRFPRNDLDLIVVFDCLFEFSQQARWMRNAAKYLKPGGRLVIIDPDPAKLGGPGHFLTRKKIHDFAAESGYSVLPADDTFLKSHMIVVLRPDPRRAPSG